MSMTEQIYFALGLHTRDRVNGVVLWDVHFWELDEKQQQKYAQEAFEITSHMKIPAEFSNAVKRNFTLNRKNYDRKRMGTTIS